MQLQDSLNNQAADTTAAAAQTNQPLGGMLDLTGKAPDSLKNTLEKSLDFSDYSISLGDVLIFVSILAGTWVLVWIVRVIINRIFRNHGPESRGKKYTLKKLSSYFLFTLGVVVGLDTMGIDITILIASSAALLVGIGLGMQHIFDDIVSGFVILFEGSIKVGDVIELGPLVARVQKIDMRTTKVMTKDGNYMIIPNSKITTDNMMNWSMETRVSRFKLEVGVAYGSDTEKVRDLLLECINANPDVLDNPAPRVNFYEFGESALMFRVFYWAHKSWTIEVLNSDLHYAIDKSFRENKIKIPYPQREIHTGPDITE